MQACAVTAVRPLLRTTQTPPARVPRLQAGRVSHRGKATLDIKVAHFRQRVDQLVDHFLELHHLCTLVVARVDERRAAGMPHQVRLHGGGHGQVSEGSGEVVPERVERLAAVARDSKSLAQKPFIEPAPCGLTVAFAVVEDQLPKLWSGRWESTR